MRRFQSRCGKPEAGEHRADLRFDGVSVARAEFAFGAMEAVGHLGIFRAGRVQLRHAARQLLLLVLEGAQIAEHGHAFGEHGAAGKREALLRQIADAGAALRRDGTGIEPFDSGQHFEQRRFAGAVGAHDAGAFVGRNQPVDVLKKDFGAVALAGPRELDHEACVNTILARGARPDREAQRATASRHPCSAVNAYLTDWDALCLACATFRR